MAFVTPPQVRLEAALGDGATFVCLLGVSYYAKVNLYYLPATQSLWAIKQADPGDVMRAEDYDRFQLEVTTLLDQPHPAIVQMWAHGIPNYSETALDFPPWIALELAPGGDLHQYVRARAVPLDEALVILYGVASALRSLHDSGWAHRDVKPANILLDAKCRPLVTGFHYIGFITPDNKGRRALIGSPGYVAPEIIRRDQKYSTKVDVYSLGMVLYNMRTAAEPRVVGEAEIPASGIVPQNPPINDDDVLRGLYERLAAVNPDDRPTAGEILAEVEAIAEANLRDEKLAGFRAYAGIVREYEEAKAREDVAVTRAPKLDRGAIGNLIEAAKVFPQARGVTAGVLRTALQITWTVEAIHAKLVEITGESDDLGELAQALFAA